MKATNKFQVLYKRLGSTETETFTVEADFFDEAEFCTMEAKGKDIVVIEICRIYEAERS